MSPPAPNPARTSSSAPGKHTVIIVHDVLGTLFSLDEPIRVLLAEFGAQLGSEEDARNRFAELVVMDWYHAAQRDFTNLSLAGAHAYTPIATVFRGTLPRILLQAGLVPPGLLSSSTGSSGSSNKKSHSEVLAEVRSEMARLGAGGGQAQTQTQEYGPYADITSRMMASLQGLTPRPGMVQAFAEVYRSAAGTGADVDVRLWGATNGSRALAQKLFSGALSRSDAGADLDFPFEPSKTVGIWSCDDISVAKPDPRVYAAVKERVLAEAGDAHNASLWFVASHSWDTDAARRAGFKTAWVSYEEFYTCSPDVYAAPDVRGGDLAQVASEIMAREQAGAKGTRG